MGSLGSLIFLLIIVAQGISAVVVALKKRQQAREAERAAERPTPSADTPTIKAAPRSQERSSSGTAPRIPETAVPGDSIQDDVAARRRQQIEELRRQADARKTGKLSARATSADPPRIKAAPRTATASTTPIRAGSPPVARPNAPVTTRQFRVEDLLGLPRREASRQASSTPPESRAPAPSAPPAPPAPPAPSAPPAMPVPGAGRRGQAISSRSRRKLLGSRSKLRDLIVMKELLDPPMALRDESGPLG